jgi:hypothetical protein
MKNKRELTRDGDFSLDFSRSDAGASAGYARDVREGKNEVHLVLCFRRPLARKP